MNYIEIVRIGLLALCCFCLLFDTFKSSKFGKSLSSSVQNILIRCFDNDDDKENMKELAEEDNEIPARKDDFDTDSFLNFLRIVNSLAVLKVKDDEKNFSEDKK